MDIQEVMKRILSADITRDNDEKGSGGFYDLSLGIAETYAAQHIPEPFSADYFNMTEAIYNALWGVFEEAWVSRSENKRKGEALRAALPVLEYIEKDQWSEAPPLGAKFDEADALVKVRAALLQYEKGGE